MRMTHQQVQTQKGKKNQEAARNTNKKVSQIEATVQQHVLQRWLSRKAESGFWFRKLLQGTISCYNQEGRHLDRLSQQAHLVEVIPPVCSWESDKGQTGVGPRSSPKSTCLYDGYVSECTFLTWLLPPPRESSTGPCRYLPHWDSNGLLCPCKGRQ